MSGETNQQQIAALLDISQMAVSKALRSEPGVSAATRQRVLETAQRLGYRPNRLATSLALGRSYLVGALLPDFSGFFFAGMLRAVEETLRNEGYSVLLRHWAYKPGTDEHDLESFQQFRADGLLVFPRAVAPWNESVYPALLQESVPIVFLDRHVDLPGACSILSDNHGGARAAVRHLLETGHSRVAMLNIDTPYSTPAIEREAGFLEALGEAGIGESDRCVVRIPATQDVEFIDRALREGLRDADGVFCFSDDLAMALMTTLQRRGISVPEKVGVIGFGDNIPYAETQRVPLTTVSQAPEEMGKLAAEALLSRMRGEPVPERIEVPTHLVVRKSSGRPGNREDVEEDKRTGAVQ